MLRGDGERRVYQEQGGGEEERGAVLRAPQVPRDQLAAAGRTEQTSPAPEALTHWELPVLPGGPEGLPGPADAGAHGCAHRHPACCVPTPHPPSSLRGSTVLAARPAAPARASPPVTRLFPEPPYAGLSGLFIRAAGARGFPKIPVTLSYCSAHPDGASEGRRMLWCPQALAVLILPRQHPSCAAGQWHVHGSIRRR